MPVMAQDSFDANDLPGHCSSGENSSRKSSDSTHQMADTGSIGRQSGDATVIRGVNARGTVRLMVDHNYEALQQTWLK